MKDDLVERIARAMNPNLFIGLPDDKCGPATASARQETRAKARAAYEIARPAIRKETLEEAAKAIKCGCCDVCGEDPDYEYVCASELAARVRALATTGQEGGR